MIGIAIAMVIGFVALTSQMHDDFSVRSKVVNAVAKLKQTAIAKLDCQKLPAINNNVESDSENVPELFSSLSFSVTENKQLTVTAVFNDVKGESGRLRIKAGRKMTIQCACQNQTPVCGNIQSDINKKYIPGKSDR